MGKIVVKKVQSQNSATAFQLPSTDGTANQWLKTDGNANLGWRTLDNEFTSTDGTSLQWKLPNTDGSANQVLQSSGTTGSTAFGSEEQGPLTDPTDSNATGWRLVDKYCPLTDTPASNFSLTVPTSMTTDPSKVYGFQINFYGLSDNGGGGAWNPEYYLNFRRQDGTTSSLNDPTLWRTNYTANRNNSQSYGNNPGITYSNYGAFNALNKQINLGNFKGASYQTWNGGNSNEVKHNKSSGNYAGIGMTGSFNMWNAAGCPQMWWELGGGISAWSASPQCTSLVWAQLGMEYYSQSYQAPFHNTTTKHTMGFNIETQSSSYNFIDGCATLWAWFENGTVS